MMYSVLMCTKNEQFKHSSRRNTKVCTNASLNICTWYKLTLYRVLEVYNLHARSWEGTEVEGFFKFEVCRLETIRRFLAAFVWSRERMQRQNPAKRKHRIHSDNLPIHSITCSCFEYDGVLLLIIIITVLVIINNYLMTWRSFAWWDLSVYCFFR